RSRSPGENRLRRQLGRRCWRREAARPYADAAPRPNRTSRTGGSRRWARRAPTAPPPPPRPFPAPAPTPGQNRFGNTCHPAPPTLQPPRTLGPPPAPLSPRSTASRPPIRVSTQIVGATRSLFPTAGAPEASSGAPKPPPGTRTFPPRQCIASAILSAFPVG